MGFIPYVDVQRKVVARGGWASYDELIEKICTLGFYAVSGPHGEIHLGVIAEEMGRELGDWTMTAHGNLKGLSRQYYFKCEQDALWARLVL